FTCSQDDSSNHKSKYNTSAYLPNSLTYYNFMKNEKIRLGYTKRKECLRVFIKNLYLFLPILL
ncbi:hypothetical protein L9F63_006192, partial [Diploptera punctata]